MLESATTDEERLKGLLLLTNLSGACAERIGDLLPRVQDLSKYGSARATARDWAERAVHAFGDVAELGAEQERLAAQLGPSADAIILELQAEIDEVLDRGRDASEPTHVGVLPLPANLPLFSDSALLRLIQAHNEGIRTLERASNQEDRLTGLLIAAGSGNEIPAHLSRRLPDLTELHASGDPTFQAHKDFASAASAQLRVNLAHFDELQEEVDDEIAERAIATAQAKLHSTDPTPWNKPAASRSPAAEGTKTCPDCAETIKAAANVCRYCGYRFAPAA